MCSGDLFQALHLQPYAFEGLGWAVLPGSGHVSRALGEGVPGLLQLGWVERWRVSDDVLLAGIEVGELLVMEVAEAAGEVAVGLEAGVVPGGLGVGA